MAPKISATCWAEYQKIRRAKLIVDSLIGEFERLRGTLQTDGERIQREIEEYNALSQLVMQLTKAISESVEKVRASVDRPQGGTSGKRRSYCLMWSGSPRLGPGEPVRFDVAAPHLRRAHEAR
jgi:hypothetical protein